MSFNSYKPFKKRNLLPKYLIVFMLGISFALFFSSAFTIVTGIDNAVQYIKQIVLTDDGTAGGTTGIVLDGVNGRIGIGTDSPQATLQVVGTILAGTSNILDLDDGYGNSLFSSILGGRENTISKSWNGIIVGGYLNTITGMTANDSFIGGGGSHTIEGEYGFIGGGVANNIGLRGSKGVIAGGGHNKVYKGYSFIGGGNSNQLDGVASTIGGGRYNLSNHDYTFIGGGSQNSASGHFSTIAGGMNNIAHYSDFIGGGQNNETKNNETYNTIGGGNSNLALGSYGFIGGGFGNIIGNNGYNTSYSAIIGGYSNALTGEMSAILGGGENSIKGNYSTIAGGYYNNLDGNNSFAAGVAINITHDNTFVWNSELSQFDSYKDGTFIVNVPDGGMGVNTADPLADLEVKDTFRISPTNYASLPSPCITIGLISFVDDASGGPQLCFCDGTDRKLVADPVSNCH